MKYKFILIVFCIFFNPLLRLTMAQPLSLVYPNDAFVTEDTSITFIWNELQGSLFYQFQLANDSSFNDLYVYQTNLLNNEFSIDSLILCKSYWWRIRAFHNAN